MKTAFIPIPLKKTEQVDWIQPLRSYLKRIYGNYKDFEDETVQFNKLRSDITGASKDTTGLDIYYKYYGQLELLDLRMPIDQHGGVNIDFKWFDSLKSSKLVSQHSLAFEKTSVLFNISAILSNIASNSIDNDDMKLGYQYFQKSAGILQFIMENFLHSPSNDLSQNMVKALQKLMISQAQEIFILRILNDENQLNSIKNSLLARLCKSASEFYRITNDLFDDCDSETFDNNWPVYCLLKSQYYNSLANYYQSIHLKETNKIGQSISYLQLSQENLKDYKNYSSPLSALNTSLVNLIKNHIDLLSNDLKILEKDNDFIYHDIIPNFNSLPEVKQMDSAKNLPIDKEYISKLIGKEIFDRIIPMSIHEQSSMYTEEQAKLLRSENEKCEIADEEFKSTLEFLRLPKSLIELRDIVKYNKDNLNKSNSTNNNNDDDDDNDDIDPRVLSISMEVSQTPLDDSKISNKRSEIYSTLQLCDTLLQNEEKQYNENKLKYGVNWTQQQFPINISEFRNDISKIRKSLLDASASDSKIKSIFDSFKNEIDILKLGPNNPKFLNSFKQNSNNNNNSDDLLSKGISLLDIDDSNSLNNENSLKIISKKLDQVDNKLQQLRHLQKERQNTYNDLKTMIHQDDISNILILNKKSNSDMDEVFKQELKKFKPYQDRILETIDTQTPLISDLKILMSDIFDDSIIKKNLKLKQKDLSTKKSVTNKFISAYENWKTYKSGIEQGYGFYDQLSNIVNSLRTNIQNFLSSRVQESQNLIQQINSSAPNRDQELLKERLSQYSYSPKTSISSAGGNTSAPPLPSLPINNLPTGISSLSGYQQPPQQYAQPYAQQPQQYAQPPQQYAQQPQQYAQQPQQYAQQPQQQQQQQHNYSTEGFYNTPSAYDPSLYSNFNSSRSGSQTNYPQQPPPPPY
ncbi:hypothetical protein B5S28_g105 [[Candida] boidinii]|nr:hypothetical protein B5S28_g105 [[Candida] boidinii]